MCEALAVLHRNGLIHGDISPRNLIVCGADLVLTDYDFVTKIGEAVNHPATVLYCSPSYENCRAACPSDDVYSLAASFFHVVYDKEPFRYSGIVAKERGLNWEGLDRDRWRTLSTFLDKATHPGPTQRFLSVGEALAALEAPMEVHTVAVTQGAGGLISPPSDLKAGVETVLREEQVEWLLSLLQSYPGSRWGNRETRGLDTDFAADTYVATKLEETLFGDILARRLRLVILCGNAGDGKTALLQHLATRLGLGKHASSERIVEGLMDDGLIVRMNLDGSAAWRGRSADELLDEFLQPFQQGRPSQDIVHLLACRPTP
jgi:serine/threonine protein kinase